MYQEPQHGLTTASAVPSFAVQGSTVSTGSAFGQQFGLINAGSIGMSQGLRYGGASILPSAFVQGSSAANMGSASGQQSGWYNPDPIGKSQGLPNNDATSVATSLSVTGPSTGNTGSAFGQQFGLINDAGPKIGRPFLWNAVGEPRMPNTAFASGPGTPSPQIGFKKAPSMAGPELLDWSAPLLAALAANQSY